MSPSPSWKREGDCLWVPRRVTFFLFFKKQFYKWRSFSTYSYWLRPRCWYQTASQPCVLQACCRIFEECRLKESKKPQNLPNPEGDGDGLWRENCKKRLLKALKDLEMETCGAQGTWNNTENPPDTSGAAFAVSDLVIYQVLQVLSLRASFSTEFIPSTFPNRRTQQREPQPPKFHYAPSH